MSSSDPKRAHVSEQEFRPKVLSEQVVFEGLEAKKSDHIVGYVRVANRALEKRVFVHYTLDNWETSREVEAYWVETVDKKTDKFIFLLPFPTDWTGTIEFAIRYEVRGVEYWDNSEEKNYVVKIGKQ